jgi:hypothetical protein
MPSRIISYAERNTQIDPPSVVNVPANTATQVLPNEPQRGEIAARYIQNTGANPLFYSFGITNATGGPVCDNLLQYHGYLPAGSQLDCSAHRKIVSVFSVAGTTVSTTTIRRNDTARTDNIIA